MKKPKVHPVAELFPMMSEEELDELAADIKVNGLRQPIVFDQDGVLIDGRNRLEACNRAGVEPEQTVLDGQDAVAFILSSNIYRRNLNKGQAAMVIAKACPLSGQGVRQLGALGKVSKTRIGQANVVLEFAADLVDAVMTRSLALNDAYQTALDRKAAANTTEKQLEKLKVEAPDLADLVSEERLKLAEAIGTLRNRKEEEKRHRQLTSRLFSEAVLLFNPQANTPAELAEHLLGAIDVEFFTTEITPEILKRSLEVHRIIVNKLSKIYETK